MGELGGGLSLIHTLTNFPFRISGPIFNLYWVIPNLRKVIIGQFSNSQTPTKTHDYGVSVRQCPHCIMAKSVFCDEASSAVL